MQLFNILHYPSLLSFLQKKYVVYRNIGNEIIIHCPYCDDSTRKNASKHGHCYLATNVPVFHCFRCDVSGTLKSLLVEIGFDDDDVLKELNHFVHHKFKNDLVPKFNNINKNEKQIDLIEKWNDIEFTNIKLYKSLYEFLENKIGNDIDFSFFGLFPNKIDNKNCISFKNFDNEIGLHRFITGDRRYKKEQYLSQNFFYFQEWNLEKYDNIVLCEGPFDIINLYLYGQFENNKTFYLSINGKSYIHNFEFLLTTELLLDKKNINIIFDNDVDYLNYIMKKILFINQLYNSNNIINFFKPEIGKDCGDYSQLIQLQGR